MDVVVEDRKATLDAGQWSRAAIGLIVLQTDETVEHDLRRIMPSDGVRLYHNRIPMVTSVTPETLGAMLQNLPAAAGLLPLHLDFASVGYACTSASMVIGEDSVRDAVQSVMPGVPVTNPFSALKAALKALNVERLGIVSPYSREVSERLKAAIEAAGLAVPRMLVFDEDEDPAVARISPQSILEAMTDVGGDPACQAVFGSCTSLRACDVLEDVESVIDKPALCSNQVLAWHMMRLADLDDRVEGFGRLFDRQLA